MENTTLTRYKNSHPPCHLSLYISKNLFRWKDSSCSQSTLCLDDESPSQMGSGAGPETGPDTVRPTVRQHGRGPSDGWGRPLPVPLQCQGLAPPPQQASEADFGIQSSIERFLCSPAGREPPKSTSSLPHPPWAWKPSRTKRDDAGLPCFGRSHGGASGPPCHTRKRKALSLSFSHPCSTTVFCESPPRFPSQHGSGPGRGRARQHLCAPLF